MDKQNILLSVSVLILIILSLNTNGALIDSEDFQNYSYFSVDELSPIGSVLFINESGGKWNCTIASSYNTNCLYIYGSPTNGEGRIGIYNDGFGNKYLGLKSIDAIGANSFLTMVRWTITNQTFPKNYTIQYKIKFDEWVTAFDYLYNTAYAEIGLSSSLTGLNSPSFGMASGYVAYNNTPEGINHFNQLRNWFITPYWYPASDTDCYIMDNSWHTINLIYNSMGSGQNITYIYVDGLKCLEQNATISAGGRNVLHFGVRGDYDMLIDDIKVYNDSVYSNPYGDDIVLDINNCPIQGCLFYDDFTYSNSNQSLLINGWSFPQHFPIIYNDTLYLNSSITGESHSIYNTLPTYNYKQIASVVQFRFNGTTPTPSSMIDQFMIFGLSAECEDSSYVAINRLYFARADEFTLSPNSTVLNAYMSYEGKPRLLGSMTYDNDEYFYMYTIYDNENRLIRVSFISADDVMTFEPEDYQFTIPYMTNCNPKNFALWRFDSQNSAVDKFIGIDKIYWFGLSAVIADLKGNTSYEWINATAYTDSINKGDWGETIMDFIESFGIRTEISKIILYGVIFIALIIACFRLPAQSGAQLYSMIGVSIIWSLISWKISLIGTALFSVIIFFMALVGAYMVREMLKGNTPPA